MIWFKRKSKIALVFVATLFILIFASCGAKNDAANVPDANPLLPILPTATQIISLPTASPTPQTLSAPATFGPNKENFPADYNPLNAQ